MCVLYAYLNPSSHSFLIKEKFLSCQAVKHMLVNEESQNCDQRLTNTLAHFILSAFFFFLNNSSADVVQRVKLVFYECSSNSRIGTLVDKCPALCH